MSSSQADEQSNPTSEAADEESPEFPLPPSGFCPLCSGNMSMHSDHNSCADYNESVPTTFGAHPLVIRFKNINVTVDYTEPDPGYETVGNQLLACFLPCIKLLYAKRRKTRRSKELNDVSGYVMPGSMTLVLGPPGSGKSTLLKVLGRRLSRKKHIKLDGTVLYNNSVLSEESAKYPIAYISQQNNVHLPIFTVRETIEFVEECRKWKTDCRHDSAYVDYILQISGLKESENRRVGTVLEGIKDSDRNRLTTAEIAMGMYSVMLYDQPSSSQDTLMTYDLIEMLRSIVRMQHTAAVLSLVHIFPESFDLFDRIILLSKGHILYQGPRHSVEGHFLKLGFKRPDHVDIGAFLQDIASGEGSQYMKPGSSLTPAVEQMALHYKESDHYKDILRIVSEETTNIASFVGSSPGIEVSVQGNDISVLETDNPRVCVGYKITGIFMPNGDFTYAGKSPDEVYNTLKTSQDSTLQVERAMQEISESDYLEKQSLKAKFSSWCWCTQVLIKRQFKIAVRLKTLALLRLIQVLVLGLFIGSLFYHKGGRIDQYEMNSMRTTGFISMMNLMLINVIQVPIHLMMFRPVFYKQEAEGLFSTSSYIIANAVLNLPQSFMETFVYSMCLYFLATLSKEKAVHYFQYWGLIFFISYTTSIFMMLVSAIASILEVGTTIAGAFIALNLLFSGAPIIPSVIGWYWRWALYIVPTRWGNVIFSSTQVDKRYALPCTAYRSFPFCLFNPTLTVGDAFLKFYEIEAGGRRLLLAYAVIVSCLFVLIYLTYLAYKKVRLTPATPMLTHEKLDTTTESDLQQAENGGIQAVRKWESILSIKPMTLSFHKLKFARHSSQIILYDVSGYAKPGTMLALVGSTHSGKTTLLNCISGRFPSGSRLEGDVLVNGFKLDRRTFSRICGFAEKLQAHQRFLTVRETVEFSASLRLDQEQQVKMNIEQYVHQVLLLFGLSVHSDYLVGHLPTSTLSRLTIAVELAGNPTLLFVEDPTTRLDAVGCKNILHILQSIALSGRTVVCTLDHPTGEALSLFNDVLILKLGGQQVYFGPVGWNCQQVLKYFTSIPGIPAYPERWNPVTYILDVLGGGIKKRQPVIDFTASYQTSALHEANVEELERLKTQDEANKITVASKYPSSYKTQLIMVFLRNQRFLWRNVRYTFGRLVGLVLLALVMGTLYLQIGSEDVLSMTSATLFPYMQLILISGLISNNVIPQLGTDRLVYYRENRARMYSPVLYPLSWGIAEVPHLLFASLVFVGISNGLAGLAVGSFSVFVRYWIGMFLFGLVITYLGIFLAHLFPLSVLSITVSSMFVSIFVASSGVSIPRYNIQFYKWLYWINPYQYAMNILTTEIFYCDTKSTACKACTITSSCPGCDCKRLLDLEARLRAVYGPVFSQYVPASFVWDRLSKAKVIEKYRNGMDFLALVIMTLLFAGLALLSFAKLKHNRRTHVF